VFEYFPGNYVWNLGVVATLNSGGLIDEVDRACRPIKEVAAQGSDVGTGDFMRAWSTLAESLVELGEADQKAGRTRSAGQLYTRAANYLAQAERMQSVHAPDWITSYRRCLELMQRSFDLVDPRTSRVEIPFRDTVLPAYFSQAPAADNGPFQWGSSGTSGGTTTSTPSSNSRTGCTSTAWSRTSPCPS
jgi:hypothetical protein